MRDDNSNSELLISKVISAEEACEVVPFAGSDDVSLEKTCKIVRAETPCAKTYGALVEPK